MTNSTITNILDPELSTSEVERMENFDNTLAILALLTELISVPILAGAILIMFQGVEINHPVYSVLFNNLLFPFFITIITIISSFASNIKIFLNVSAFGNMISLLHHHSSWMVLSGLRYAYIVKPDWLHSTWPDVKHLRYVSVAIVYISLTLFVALALCILLIFVVPFGWPKIHFWAIPSHAKVKIVGIFLIAHYFPAFCGLLIYILLVYATTYKVSKVGVLQSEENRQVSNNPNSENLEMSSTYDTAGIYVGKEIPSQLNDSRPQLNVINFPGEEASQIKFLADQSARITQEQISAMRSLKTNLVVFFVGMIAGFLIYLFPDKYHEQLNMFFSSLQKLLFPVLTTVANFGTIRSVIKLFLGKLCDTHQVFPLIWQ